MIIYLATNKENGKGYIGQTVYSLSVRWSQHIHNALKKNSQHILYKAIRKYGKDVWDVRIIDTASSKEELNKKEINLINQYNTHYLGGLGYNMNFGGNSKSGWKEDPRKTILRTSKNNKPIMCVETGKIFESIKAAALELKVTPGFLRNVCAGIKPTAKGFTFEYVNKENIQCL